jgi:hypothetical protein
MTPSSQGLEPPQNPARFNPVADKILEVIRAEGRIGKTAMFDLFDRNIAGQKLSDALLLLEGLGLIFRADPEPSSKPGRREELWTATPSAPTKETKKTNQSARALAGVAG